MLILGQPDKYRCFWKSVLSFNLSHFETALKVEHKKIEKAPWQHGHKCCMLWQGRGRAAQGYCRQEWAAEAGVFPGLTVATVGLYLPQTPCRHHLRASHPRSQHPLCGLLPGMDGRLVVYASFRVWVSTLPSWPRASSLNLERLFILQATSKGVSERKGKHLTNGKQECVVMCPLSVSCTLWRRLLLMELSSLSVLHSNIVSAIADPLLFYSLSLLFPKTVCPGTVGMCKPSSLGVSS